MENEYTESMNAIDRKRGNTLSNFSYIEFLITKIIIKNYNLKDDIKEQQITTDILEDEYISFGAKLRILKKIINKYHPAKYKKFPFGKIEELNKLRNIIAHSSLGMKIDQKTAIATSQILFIHGGEEKEAEVIISKYNHLKNGVQTELEKFGSESNYFTPQIWPNKNTK